MKARYELALVGLLVGCKPSAPLFAPTPSAIDAGFNQSWNAVIDVLAEDNVPVKTLDRSSGFVVAEVSAMSLSDLSNLTTNCGGFVDIMLQSDVKYGIANYNILIRGDSNTSMVKVTARFTHASITCQSKNLFENNFQTAVKTRAEAGSHGVRASVTQSAAPQPPVVRAQVTPVPAASRRVTATTTPNSGGPSGMHAQASIGPPQSEADRAAAVEAFEQGKALIGSHEWAKAEQSFQQAVLFDGSVAKYHAALGALMMTLHRWVDAEASYSAAMLIDPDNPDYRRLLKESRARVNSD